MQSRLASFVPFAFATVTVAFLFASIGSGQSRPDAGHRIAAPSHTPGEISTSQDDAGLGRATTFTPRNACVTVPQIRYRVRRTVTQASPPDPERPYSTESEVSMGTTSAGDIDGDGQPDSLVPEPARGDCVQDYHFAVYVMRGACGHRVGVIYGMLDVDAMGTAPRSHGLSDLTTHTERGRQSDPRVPARLHRETRTYRFDGIAYRELHNAASDSICHHCPIESCESVR